MAGRNEDIPAAVSQLRHSHLDGVPHVRNLHLGAYTPSSPPREWGLVPVPASGTAQFITPPYALEMCLHLPVGVHYYRACSGADPWPRNVLSLVGAVHCVQVTGSHQLQLCRKGLPPTSFILPEHHHVVLPQSLHSRVSITATGLTRASVLAMAATYHHRHLRKWVRGLPCALPAAVDRKLTQHSTAAGSCPGPPPTGHVSPRPDVMTLNVQMSLRPKLRALDVLVRECQYPLTLHVQEAGPLIIQRVHPLYHTIQAPARIAGGCATLLYRTPDLVVTGHSAHPSGRALVTHFTMACVPHCHANVYFHADGNLDTLQEILDWVYPYLLLTPARVVVLTGDLNANCRWVSHLPVSPASLCDLVLPTLTRLGMRRLRPLAEAPTWVSPQGFAGALDHIFLRTPSEAAHTTEVRSDSSFPSDHLPVTATLHDLPPAPQLVCPSKKGRFPIPREPLASQLRTLNDTFRAELATPPPGAPEAQPRYTEVTSALYTAATAAYGPPVPSQPVPSTVRVHVTNLQRYTLAYPDWASQSSHLVEVARLKERIRAAWDVLLLEKDVGLAPLPATPGQPTKVDYRRTLGARYVPPADPVYVVGVPVPLHQQAAVALDQLRQRHLAPLEALSLARVRTITGWEERPLGPPPNATTANLRAIIRRAAATVPYHDLLEYRLFGQLEDAQFAAIVSLINSILRGVPVPQAHSADFINLPKKTPHGPIANGRPLTNLATIWKLTAALIKDHYQPRLVQNGILPPYQFGMSPHCSSVELLRVLHDVWWDRWRRRLEAWVLSDDVRHAYGSINHTTEYAVLTAAGISPADAATLQHHDRALEVHMGGADGRSPSSTRLGAGTGQGCPVSGMKYCIYGEVRGHEACRSVPPTDTPAGPLNRVLLMDDTQWLPGDRCHLPALASGIERAGRLTNLHSDPTKTVLIGTDMRDGQVYFLNDTVYLNGHPVRCATSQDYVRVLGRHALPHLFHPVDSRRLFSGARAACRALRAPRLPAHYPLAMYTAKCHGTVNWFTSVRPPSYGALRVLDAMTASAMRATAGWTLSASAHFLREVPEGGVGIPPAPVVGFTNFFGVYIRHLNHPNSLVCRSTRHGLLTALWRFHPSQPCLTPELGLRCTAHPTDHDLFVALCHRCDIAIHLPPDSHLPHHTPHVLALSSPGLEVQDTHAWMLAGHRSTEDARRKGWPRASPRPTPPVGTVPPVRRCQAVTATVPTFSWLPENYGILHDASWCPKTRRCGGAVAVFCPVTLRYQVYPVPIPLRLDNAYTAELYTAWVALTAKGPSADPAIGFRSGAWHFADCKGYITAQEGRREPEDSLQGDLIRSCRDMAHGHAPPHHLYSHIAGTWLDTLLDRVDEAAGQAADNCPDAVGWLGPLQKPRVCFSHAGIQVHDAVPHARRALLASHHTFSASPPPQRLPDLNEYANIVSHGLVTWGDHLTVTGIRLSLFPPRDTSCPLCTMPASGDHILSCPLDPLIRAHYHRWLAARLSQRCHAWRHCTPTAWGTLVLWGDEPFILAVDGSPAHHTIATYTVGRLGAISTPHRDALLHRGLRPARLRRLLCDVVLTTVLLHKRHAVPVLPLADHLSPLPRAPVNQSLANDPPPEWYHVANWAPTPGSGRWPAWDVLLGLWLSGDLLLAPKVKSVISTRSKHSPYRVLYVYNGSNQIPPTMWQEIEQNPHDVIILDSLGRHGLAPHLPGRRRLWAIHYGGNGRSLEAGLCGDVIPSWCAALHSAFSAILTAASQGPRTVFKDMQVAMGRPAPWPCPRP